MDSDTVMDPTVAAGAPVVTGGRAPVTVVGHRGDPYRVRENTLRSIASAIERGRTRSRSTSG